MTTEGPKVPRLSDMPEVGDLSLPGQKTPEKSEDFMGVLPEELRVPIQDFMRNLGRTILAQQTVDGSGEVRVTEKQVEFYKQRFNEVLDSGLLNPRINPLKKISE